MNKRINKIETMLMKKGSVIFVKHHKNEYIEYSFHIDKNKNITRQVKAHYSNGESSIFKKRKLKETNLSTKWFLEHTVYDLLNRGYRLKESDND